MKPILYLYSICTGRASRRDATHAAGHPCHLPVEAAHAASRGDVRAVTMRRELLLVHAAAVLLISAKHNGKSFRSTGAWTLSHEYMHQNRCKNDTSAFGATNEIECAYKLDARLASCLASFFRGLSVTELGAGVGRYKRVVDASGLAREYTAYDGLSNVAALTRGKVSFADLTVDNVHLRTSDFALSLEVFEHIPAQFEQALLANINRANRLGIVVSWSNMGATQSQHGHVNAKRKSQVRMFLAPFSYVEDRNASAHLRRCATFLYLKRGIQVFRRGWSQANRTTVSTTVAGGS